MPSIPASGPISMSMFNTVVGRASNTSNSKLAGGSTITTDSLFYLASLSGSINTTAPHAMSEWYGYTTVTTYSATLYYNFYSNPSSETLSNFGLYYSIDTGGDTLITSLDVGSGCTEPFTVTGIAAGSTVYFGVKTVDKIGDPVNYDLSIITCPDTYNLTYCGTNNTSPASPYSYTANSSRTFYITIAAAKGFFNMC